MALEGGEGATHSLIAVPPPPPFCGGGAKAGLLQTQQLLQDCQGEPAQWLLQAEARTGATAADTALLRWRQAAGAAAFTSAEQQQEAAGAGLAALSEQQEADTEESGAAASDGSDLSGAEDLSTADAALLRWRRVAGAPASRRSRSPGAPAHFTVSLDAPPASMHLPATPCYPFALAAAPASSPPPAALLGKAAAPPSPASPQPPTPEQGAPTLGAATGASTPPSRGSVFGAGSAVAAEASAAVAALEASNNSAWGAGSSPLPVRRLEAQLEQQQLLERVASLEAHVAAADAGRAAAEAEAAAVRDALACAQAAAEGAAAEVGITRGAAAQAAASLQAGAQEREELVAQLEAFQEACCQDQGRQAALQQQLELLLLERQSETVEALEAGGAAGAVDAATGAFMAEIQLLRSQLQSAVSAKTSLATALQRTRGELAGAHARMQAERGEHERYITAQAVRAAQQVNAANARCAAAREQAAATAAQTAALQRQLAAAQQQLVDGGAAGNGSRGSSDRAAVQQAEAALREQQLLYAEMQRQLEEARQGQGEALARGEAVTLLHRQTQGFEQVLESERRDVAHWQRQANDLAAQLAASQGAEGESRAALQETCTRLVAQQQLCHEQQEELGRLRARCRQPSTSAQAASAAASAPTAGMAPLQAHPAVAEQQRITEALVGSGLQHPAVAHLRQGSHSSEQQQQQPLGRTASVDSLGSGAATPTGSTGSAGSARQNQRNPSSASSGGGKRSWLSFKR